MLLGGAGNRMNRAFDLVENNSENIETEIESLRNLIISRKRTEVIFDQSTKGDMTTNFKLRETLNNFDIIQVVLESGGGIQLHLDSYRQNYSRHLNHLFLLRVILVILVEIM